MTMRMEALRTSLLDYHGPDREERMRAITRDVPLDRFGTADEVAHAVVWLASDESTYTTGAELVRMEAAH
jgi:NAD(P)-dependent dehydrogenase (short-subunit alcohol dehydrogenase family)